MHIEPVTDVPAQPDPAIATDDRDTAVDQRFSQEFEARLSDDLEMSQAAQHAHSARPPRRPLNGEPPIPLAEFD